MVIQLLVIQLYVSGTQWMSWLLSSEQSCNATEPNTHTHTHTHTPHTFTHKHTHTHTQTYKHTFTHKRAHMHTYKCKYMHTQTHAHAHTCTHTYTHAHMCECYGIILLHKCVGGYGCCTISMYSSMCVGVQI